MQFCVFVECGDFNLFCVQFGCEIEQEYFNEWFIILMFEGMYYNLVKFFDCMSCFKCIINVDGLCIFVNCSLLLNCMIDVVFVVKIFVYKEDEELEQGVV